MKVEQVNDKRDGLSHILVINYPKLGSLYGSAEQACQLVKDDAQKQETRVKNGKSRQSDKDRCMRVVGYLSSDGIWRARDPAKLRGTLAENGLFIESQRVEADRANLGPMVGPGQNSSIGAVCFARPRGSRAQLRPPSMPARLVVAVAP